MKDMSLHFLISHPLHRTAPLYPGTPPVGISQSKLIAAGDSANTSMITFSSHSGTHIDLPRHFCQNGASVSSMLSPETIIEPTYCIDVEKSGESPIRIEDLQPYTSSSCNLIRNAEALLIRTGFSSVRATDPDTYAAAHPWVHPEVPDYLRRVCPSLRLFGIDTISIAVPSHRQEGRECHRAFLCQDPPILLLEDLNLGYPSLSDGPWRLRLYPVLFDELDGVPIIALADMMGNEKRN